MEINVEKLADVERKYVRDMDSEDLTALKVCLLSAGALAGLAVRGKVVRRLLGLGCTVLTAGLALPLVSQYLDRLAQEDQPVLEIKAERGEGEDAQTLFEARVDVDKKEE